MHRILQSQTLRLRCLSGIARPFSADINNKGAIQVGNKTGSIETPDNYYKQVKLRKVDDDGSQLVTSENVDLAQIKDLSALTRDQRRGVLETKFNLHFPKTMFNERKNSEFNQQRFGPLLTWELYNWQYFARGPQGSQLLTASKGNAGQKQPPTWTLHDGPPFANGRSHVGNLYNKVLKDIINRYKLLQGYRVHYIPGFDCFGTHTEDFFTAEKSLQKVKDLNLSLGNQSKREQRELNDEEKRIMGVREIVEPGVKDSMMLQMNELQQWGIMTDWRYSYFTLMPSYQAMVIRKFGQFMQKGMVVRSDRPVFWSVESQKVLAEDEMVRSTEIIDCVVMKLPITRFGKKAQHVQELYPDAKALVFCSEPWRVVGMNAAAINENVVYVLAKWQDEYLIVAEKRLGELQMRTGQKFKKLVTLSGDSLDGLVLQHPMNGRDVPLIVNNEVTSDHGTGIDCVSPAHDLESLKVAYHYDLSREGHVDEHGLLTEDLGPIFSGQSVFDPKTNDLVAGMMREEGFLLSQFPFQNAFFENEATKERVILRSAKSWFLQISERLKMKCFNELETIKFTPKLNHKETEQTHKDFKTLKRRRGKKQKDLEEIDSYYVNIVEELNDFNDWCISDNNLWGIPIPFFTFKDTGNILVDQEIIEHFAELVENFGTSDIWYTFDIVDLLPKRYQGQASELQKGYQVFDSWFDSSLSWSFALENQIHEKSQVYQQIKTELLLRAGSEQKNGQETQRLGQGRSSSRRNVQAQEAPAPTTANHTKLNALIDSFPNQLLQDVGKEEAISYRMNANQVKLLNQQSAEHDLTQTFPADLYLEGCDQHSRWFLCSLVTSVALQKQAPFRILKTHGLILDEANEKMSKSHAELLIDPEDLISGTEKLDGSRAFGFGTDVMRLWAACLDDDKNKMVSQQTLEECNQRIKLFRSMMKNILGNLDGFQSEVGFDQLTAVDQMVLVSLVKFLSQQQALMDKQLDIKQYIANHQEFMISTITNFYLEFSQNRLLTQKGTKEFASSQQTLLHILNSLMISAAPITIYTCQEIFHSMDSSLFPNGIKPKTVFQLPWPIGQIQKDMDQQFLQNFEQQKKFEQLLEIRRELRQIITKPDLKPQMHNQGDLKGLEFIVISDQPDSDVATLFEMLGDDASSFFFDCDIQVMTEDQSKQLKGPLAKGYLHPLRTSTHEVVELGEVKIQIYKAAKMKCQRCLKYEIEKPALPAEFKNKPIIEKICEKCQTLM